MASQPPSKTTTTTKMPMRTTRTRKLSTSSNSSIYPLHPEGTQVLVRVAETDMTFFDQAMVVGSSMVVLGSLIWVPTALIRWAWRQYQALEHNKRKSDENDEDKNKSEQEKRRFLYKTLLWSILAGWILIGQRSPRIGKLLRFREWTLWKSWLRYVAFTVLLDNPDASTSTSHRSSNNTTDPVIFAMMPHGIFPFTLALSVLPVWAQQAFGIFRPVVAPAVHLFPVVRSILGWCDPINAYRADVHRALAEGRPPRIGVVPGGIAEIFEARTSYDVGHQQPHQSSNHDDDEHVIVRKGILRMALKYGVPVIPVYCFGGSRMLAQFHSPWLERLSVTLRIALVIFYGRLGLPIPFRQKLLYVMGRPIVPPTPNDNNNNTSNLTEQQQVDEMHQQFCDEVQRLFERHKEAYGWGHKTLQLVTR